MQEAVVKNLRIPSDGNWAAKIAGQLCQKLADPQAAKKDHR